MQPNLKIYKFSVGKELFYWNKCNKQWILLEHLYVDKELFHYISFYKYEEISAYYGKVRYKNKYNKLLYIKWVKKSQLKK